MRCAQCGEDVAADPCPSCGGSPLLDGRYRIDALIGEGSFGAMLRATRLSDGAAVAIKEIPLRWSDAEKTRELIAREARVLAELSHPSIPRFIEQLTAGEGRSRASYIVQEHIPGTDLQSLPLRRSADEVLDILAELLPILSYLHSRSPPVIHRDIKPGNVIRADDGRLVLVDFGAVRDALRDRQLGGSTVAGTFGYMAPEQFMGEASPATDLYGLGALAVALLTRQEPQALLDASQRLRWRHLVDVPAPTADFIDALLAPDRADRIASADEAARRLEALRRQPAPAPALALAPAPAAPATTTRWAEPSRASAAFPEPELFEPPAANQAGGGMSKRTAAGLAAGLLLPVFTAIIVLGFLGAVLLFSGSEPPPPAPAPTPPAQVMPTRFSDVLDAARACSFDDCREDIIGSLLRDQTPLTVPQAGALAELCSFDDCRESVLVELYPQVAAPAPTTSDVGQLAQFCSFDDCREAILIANYPLVTDPERYLKLLEIFSFDSSRTSVREKLGL